MQIYNNAAHLQSKKSNIDLCASQMPLAYGYGGLNSYSLQPGISV